MRKESGESEKIRDAKKKKTVLVLSFDSRAIAYQMGARRSLASLENDAERSAGQLTGCTRVRCCQLENWLENWLEIDRGCDRAHAAQQNQRTLSSASHTKCRRGAT